MQQQAGHQRRHGQHAAQTTEPGHEQSDNQSQGVSCENELYIVLAERKVAPRFSENRVGGNCTRVRGSDNKDFTHCSSVVAAIIARYLALVEERAIVCCFVEL